MRGCGLFQAGSCRSRTGGCFYPNRFRSVTLLIKQEHCTSTALRIPATSRNHASEACCQEGVPGQLPGHAWSYEGAPNSGDIFRSHGEDPAKFHKRPFADCLRPWRAEQVTTPFILYFASYEGYLDSEYLFETLLVRSVLDCENSQHRLPDVQIRRRLQSCMSSPSEFQARRTAP